MVTRLVAGLILAWFVVPTGQISALPVDLGAGLTPAAEVVCVPPGVPPFSSWRITNNSQSAILLDEVGRPMLAVVAAYEAQGQTIATIWVGTILASVDPAPQDRTAPAWYDSGAVTPTTTLKVERRQACQWFKPAPKPPRGEERT